MSRINLRYNKNDSTWLLIFFIFVMQDCFGLINVQAINIAGVFAFSDIWLVAFLAYFGCVALRYLPTKSKDSYGLIICLLIVSCVIAAIQQNYYTGQSIGLGLRPQRRFIIVLLAYFPIRKMAKHQRINWNKLLDYLMVWGVISAIIFIVQKLVYPSVQFIYALMNYRNGSLRIYMDSTLIDIAVLIASYKFFKDLKMRYLVAAIIGLVYVIWVSQGRMELISILFGVSIGFLLTRKLDRKKMLLWMALIVVIGVFLASEYGEYLVSSVLSAEDTEDNTMAIRYLGRELYFEQLFSSVRSLLLGCGYPNELYAPAMEKAGASLNIGLNDNGIFGFFYVHGLFGVVLILFMVARALKMSWLLHLRNEDNVPIMYLGMICLMAYNIVFWYWNADGTLVLILMISYIEDKYNRYIDGGR